MRPSPVGERQLRQEAAEDAHQRHVDHDELDRALRSGSLAPTRRADDPDPSDPQELVQIGWKDRIERFSGPREAEFDQPFAPLPEDALWRQGPSGGDWRADVPRTVTDGASALRPAVTPAA